MTSFVTIKTDNITPPVTQLVEGQRRFYPKHGHGTVIVLDGKFYFKLDNGQILDCYKPAGSITTVQTQPVVVSTPSPVSTSSTYIVQQNPTSFVPSYQNYLPPALYRPDITTSQHCTINVDPRYPAYNSINNTGPDYVHLAMTFGGRMHLLEPYAFHNYGPTVNFGSYGFF
jgi:hypothetical protein